MSRLIAHKITKNDGASPVVSLAEAKAYMRVDFNDDDAIISSLIDSSTARLQEYTGRVFLPSACEAHYRQEGCGDMVRLVYSDNIELTNGSTSYADSLVLDEYLQTDDKEVKLTYTAGYAEMPEWIKTAVLLDVSWRYENRGDVAATVINTEVKDYLMPYVNWSYL
jgi:hypothetical protein